MKHIAIFASGNGTNAENIIRYFSKRTSAIISLVCSNNPKAAVLEKAKQLGVETLVFDKKDFFETDRVYDFLLKKKIDLIVLAGFLWLMPEKIIRRYENKIVNIHPALLPAYGGKGMYGSKVHEAVIAAKEKLSGISIHFVNKNFDEGEIIFQKKCAVDPDETAESLAKKIHQLEYKYYPEVIEELLKEIT